jgi:CheY-like chemotaxis protein
VTAVSTAREVLAVRDRELSDVFVSDILMPNATDYDLMPGVHERTDKRGGTLPAVALTAMAGVGVREAGLAARQSLAFGGLG